MRQIHPATSAPSSYRRVLAAVACLILSSGVLRAQEPASTGSLSIRIADRTPSALFGTLDVGRTILLAGMLQVRKSDYREAVVGVGGSAASANASLTLVAALSQASDGWYGQLYVFPALRAAKVTVSGVGVVYEPLGPGGIRQFHWNPLSVTLRVRPRLDFGGATVLSLVAGALPVTLVGPTVRIDVGRARSLEFTFLRDPDDDGDEVRFDARVRF